MSRVIKEFRVINFFHFIKRFLLIKRFHFMEGLNFRVIIQFIIQNYIHVQINTHESDSIMALIYCSINHYST